MIWKVFEIFKRFGEWRMRREGSRNEFLEFEDWKRKFSRIGWRGDN